MNERQSLRSVAQPAREPFFWARLYGRRLSWPLTWLFLKTPLSANAISVLSIVIGAAGGLCFAANALAWNIAAAALILLSWVLDCVDGEVARARGATSLDGEFIDACRHQIVAPAMFAGLTLGAHLRHPAALWLVALGLGATVFSSRFVGGMIDQMVLEGVRRALKKGPLPERAEEPRAPGPPGRRSVADLVRPFFVDFNILHILIVAVGLDAAGLRAGVWTPLDLVHIAYGVAFPIVKLGSMARAWRRGVSGRVDDVLRGRGPDTPHH